MRIFQPPGGFKAVLRNRHDVFPGITELDFVNQHTRGDNNHKGEYCNTRINSVKRKSARLVPFYAAKLVETVVCEGV